MRSPNDGKYHLPLVSASQISLYEACARKWGFTYLSGIRSSSTPASELGTEVDDTQLQPYLRDGRPFDFTRESGYIAASGLAYLPSPQSPGLEVQKHFVMPSPTWINGAHVGFGFQGYIDLWLPDSALVPGFKGGVPFVGDFKTSKDIKKWGKDEAALRIDVQAMLYATYALFSTGAREADLGWLYMQTQGPRKAKRTDVRVGAAHVAERFGLINDTAVKMFAIRQQNPDPLDLPPMPTNCRAFGRDCEFTSLCNLSPEQMIGGLVPPEERNTMADSTDLLASLKAKKLAALGGAPAVVAGPVVVAALAPVPAPVAPAPTEPAPAAPARTTAKVDPGPQIPPRPPSTAPALGINPPEAALAPAPAVGTSAKPSKGAKAVTSAGPIDLKVLAKEIVDELFARIKGAA